MQQRLIFFLALGGFGYAVLAPPAATDPAAPTASASSSPGAPSAAFFAADDTIAINRGPGGQFHLTGQVDGQDTEFLVDTGADIVALTVDEAERLGLAVDPAEFVPLTRTASGVGHGIIVRIDKLEIAGGEFTDVEAAVIEGLTVNLLGQSVLGRFAQVSLRGDRMVIRR